MPPRAMGGGARAMGGGHANVHVNRNVNVNVNRNVNVGVNRGGGFGRPPVGEVLLEAAVIGAVAGRVAGRSQARAQRSNQQQQPNVIVIDGATGQQIKPVVIPFSVQSVRLPEERMEKRGDVTFFCIEATQNDGFSTQVARRYNDFHALHKSLGPHADRFPDAPFPGKTGCAACSGEHLMGRRRGLEIWLFRIIQQPQCQGNWKGRLTAFLQAGGQAVANQQQQQYQAPAPAPAMPVAAAHAPAPAPPAGEGLAVEVPAGVGPGQVFEMEMPDGQHMAITVPQGTQPGETLQLWFDPAAGTIKLLK